MKYVKKPVVIEAWKTGSDELVPDWLQEAFDTEKVISHGDSYVIDTLEGAMTCGNGDYIIRGVHGELYPCKGDIFHETYSKIKTYYKEG